MPTAFLAAALESFATRNALAATSKAVFSLAFLFFRMPCEGCHHQIFYHL